MRRGPLAPFAAAMLAASLAQAQAPPPPSPLRINYSAELDFTLGPGTRGCPDEAYLHQEIARQLGYDPLAPDPKRERIGRFRVAIQRSKRGLMARMEYAKVDGVVAWARPTEDDYDACKDVFKAVAFAIAAELTAQAAETPVPQPEPTPPAPAPAPLPAPEPPITPPTPTPTVATPSPSALRVRGEVGATLLGAFGLAPAPAAGGALHLGIALVPPGRLWFTAGAEGRLDAPVSTNGSAGLKTGLLGMSGLGCLHVDASFWNGSVGYPFVCAAGTWANIRASYESTAGGTASLRRDYFGFGGRLGFEVRLATFASLVAHVDLRGTAHVAYLRVANQRETWRTPDVTGDLGAGVIFFLGR